MEDSGSEVDSSDQEDGFVPRERSNTCGSLSDLGKKRKQEPLAQESSHDRNPEEDKEPKQKRVKPTSKLKRFSQSFQRLSFRMDVRASPLTPRLWGKGSRGPSKARGVKLWSETFDSVREELSLTEVRRQEAIFELTQGEQSLIDDLNITKRAYFDPMLKLCIMSEDELNQIFGSLYSLIPLHEDLLSRLQQVRKADGTVSEVGSTLIEWFPSLQAYEQYCCNLIAAKSLLDYKKQEQRVTEFLTLCQESSFSRKLDLWNFLDLPRSRLFKYPLLLREIARYTPAQHPDSRQLDTAIELIQGIVATVNLKTGEAECHYYRERLLYLDHSQNEPLIHSSKVLCCHGELRNNKGAKLQVFLFDQVLVITRTVSRNDLPLFQVYRTPIPLRQLILEDLPDGEARLGVSFRGAFGNSNERARNVFRVSFRERTRGQSHTFQADDTFNKQQWISCIRQAVVACHDRGPSPPPAPNLPESSLQQIAELSLEGEGDGELQPAHTP